MKTTKYIFTFLLILTSLKINAETHYVSNAGTHTPPYTNWFIAATNIQSAVDISKAGDNVQIDFGEFFPVKEILITNAINIIGRDENPTNTIIDSQWLHRCFFISNANAVIRNLTITHGKADGARYPTDDLYPTNCGGGVFIFNDGTLSNCIFIDNIATGKYGEASTTNKYETPSGGAVYCCYGGTILDCRFYNNVAIRHGGGVAVMENAHIENCVFGGNSASHWIGNGGGVYFYKGGEIWNSLLTNNYAAYGGGGVFSYYAGAVENCVISNNSAGYCGGGIGLIANNWGGDFNSIWATKIIENNAGTYGGGIYMHSWTAGAKCGSVENSIIEKNSASIGGGIMCDADAVKKCFISKNIAAQSAGGILVGNEAELINSIVCSNVVTDATTAQGGGAYSYGQINNCKIYKNISSNCGGGIFICRGVVSNSFIAENFSSNSGGGICFESDGLLISSTVTGNFCLLNGGGVFFKEGGMSFNSEIIGNASPNGAGIFHQAGGDTRNCVITENHASMYGGGALCFTGGIVESSTIVNNTSSDSGGGVYCLSNAMIRNSILYFNVANAGSNYFINQEGTFNYCCVLPKPPGEKNIDGNPLFLNNNFAKYNLTENSPCVQAGTNYSWMTSAIDYDGKSRVIGSKVDIGAFELPVGAYGQLFSSAKIDFTPEYSFPVGEVTNVTIKFVNIGTTNFNGEVTNIFSPFFVINGSPYSVEIGDTHTIEIQFAPADAGYWEQEIHLTGGNEIIIDLKGSAYIPEPPWVFLIVNLLYIIIRRK